MTRLTPKQATIFTAIFAAAITTTLVSAANASGWWWGMIVLTVVFLGGTILMLVQQVKNPASAILMMRAWVIPSACMALFAWLVGYVITHHDLQMLSSR